MRIPAGAVLVEPWTNDERCIECISQRSAALYVIEEPILVLVSVVRGGVTLLKNVLMVVGQGSLMLRSANDALECACEYMVVERDAWGKAKELASADGATP